MKPTPLLALTINDWCHSAYLKDKNEALYSVLFVSSDEVLRWNALIAQEMFYDLI